MLFLSTSVGLTKLFTFFLGVASEMLSLQLSSSLVSAAEVVSALLGSYNSSFLLGGIDFSGTHLLVLGGESKVRTAKPCKYTAISLGAEIALGVLIARFLPGMSVKDAHSAVMQALFHVIVESNNSSLNGSVFIIGLDSFHPSLNYVFCHGRGDSSKGE
ncbi:putative nucleophile aminohydrolase [Rosa chinensis]|uniref:Putative nucleophile aminohydrolase n=1 Tax=Rosa chinensis TaxID=74649 RepID=A0A2P6RBL7_ROSCH|nr:putative nucleophile aminohydrolase [Rosa chinensis]